MRSTCCFSAAFRRKSQECGDYRGGKPKGLPSYSRALRAYPGSRGGQQSRPGTSTTAVGRSDWTVVGGFAALRMSRPPCGEAERPGPTRRGLTILHPDDCPSPNLRQSSTKSAQCSAHPAEGWQVTAEVSEKSPVRLCVQRRKSAFFFHRARRILFRQDEKEWGVQSPRFSSHPHHPGGCIPRTRTGASTVAARRFPAPLGPPIVPLPRNRLAVSAAGGASPVSP